VPRRSASNENTRPAGGPHGTGPFLRSVGRRGGGDEGRFPFSVAAIRSLERLDLSAAVTFFVGENGSGKSTLLEAIALSLGFNAEGGALRELDFSTRASHSVLHELLEPRPREVRYGFFLRAESVFNLATEIERVDREGWARALPRRTID